MAERLTEGEIDEFSRLFSPGRQLTAKLLRLAGVDTTALPAPYGSTSYEYWSAVDDLIAEGRVENGRGRLLGAALDICPHSAVLRCSLRAGQWRVLFIGSSPSGMRRVRADREFRAVEEVAPGAAGRGRGVEVVWRPAATVADIAAIREVRPEVLHLACHGDGLRLTFEDVAGQPYTVHADDLAGTLGAYAEQLGVRLRGIVLSCCSGADAAEALWSSADEVVAHSLELDDECAVSFSHELYRALPDAGSLVSAARVAAAETVLADGGCRTLRDRLILLPARLTSAEPPANWAAGGSRTDSGGRGTAVGRSGR